MNILRKQSDLPFSRKGDRKKEKSTVSFMHVQNIICSQTQLDGIAHEQTIIWRQLFAGHVVGCQPMKRKKNLLQMIISIIYLERYSSLGCCHSCVLPCQFVSYSQGNLSLYSFKNVCSYVNTNRTTIFWKKQFPEVALQKQTNQAMEVTAVCM